MKRFLDAIVPDGTTAVLQEGCDTDEIQFTYPGWVGKAEVRGPDEFIHGQQVILVLWWHRSFSPSNHRLIERANLIHNEVTTNRHSHLPQLCTSTEGHSDGKRILLRASIKEMYVYKIHSSGVNGNKVYLFEFCPPELFLTEMNKLMP